MKELMYVSEDELYIALVQTCLDHELRVTPQQNNNIGQRIFPDGVAARSFNAAESMMTEFLKRRDVELVLREKEERQVA